MLGRHTCITGCLPWRVHRNVAEEWDNAVRSGQAGHDFTGTGFIPEEAVCRIDSRDVARFARAVNQRVAEFVDEDSDTGWLIAGASASVR